MSLLESNRNGPIEWTTDRDKPTPAHFGEPHTENENLSQNVALVDFSHRGLVEIGGPERVTFLSGLITNQIRDVTANRSIYTALLSPQGRFQWDFTIIQTDDRLILDTEPDRIDTLVRTLNMYQMRTKATIRDVSQEFGTLGIVGPQADSTLAALFPNLNLAHAELGTTLTPAPMQKLWQDPRHVAFGWRLLLPASQYVPVWQQLAETIPPIGFTAWENYRIQHGLPRGGAELIPETTLPLEAGLMEMHGVSFQKGCYIGQETTARTHNRGTLKKRLFQFTIDGEGVIPTGTSILLPSGHEAGTVTSTHSGGTEGLALLRLADVARGEILTALGRNLTARKPDWATWALA